MRPRSSDVRWSNDWMAENGWGSAATQMWQYTRWPFSLHRAHPQSSREKHLSAIACISAVQMAEDAARRRDDAILLISSSKHYGYNWKSGRASTFNNTSKWTPTDGWEGRFCDDGDLQSITPRLEVRGITNIDLQSMKTIWSDLRQSSRRSLPAKTSTMTFSETYIVALNKGR